jgi:hypothetical protein
LVQAQNLTSWFKTLDFSLGSLFSPFGFSPLFLAWFSLLPFVLVDQYESNKVKWHNKVKRECDGCEMKSQKAREHELGLMFGQREVFPSKIHFSTCHVLSPLCLSCNPRKSPSTTHLNSIFNA